MKDKYIIDQLQKDVRFLLNKGLSNNPDDLWTSRTGPAWGTFVDADGKIIVENLRNFRRKSIFVSEHPNYEQTLLNYIPGHRRSQFAYLDVQLDILISEKADTWLSKYPIDDIGNPISYKKAGYKFNLRWLYNVRYLGLLVKNLTHLLASDKFSIVDIGGGYGIFLYLLKKEFPDCKLTLVEFPEQLILAYYYLKSNFPDAKINSMEEVYSVSKIDRDFVEKYDFLLIPIECYSKVESGAFDLISNFISLGEMNNDWFDDYRNSDAFKAAPYLFTINRIYSRPTYQNDIDILRYRLHEYESIHFELSPYEPYYIQSYMKFFYQRKQFTSQFFEFIGGPRIE